MYDWSSESKEDTSVTSDRKGNSPVRSSFVEIAAALKAGQVVESASEMQSFCAIAMGRLLANIAPRAALDFRRVAGRRW